jgi:iron donor protein CyaY
VDETRFQTIADAALTHCFDQLETAYDNGSVEELELQGGILTIKTETGRTFLLSKHTPSFQIWLASPVSGGLHFRFDDATTSWKLPDGTALYELLRQELSAEHVTVVL